MHGHFKCRAVSDTRIKHDTPIYNVLSRICYVLGCPCPFNIGIVVSIKEYF